MQEVFRHWDTATVGLVNGLLEDAGIRTVLRTNHRAQVRRNACANSRSSQWSHEPDGEQWRD